MLDGDSLTAPLPPLDRELPVLGSEETLLLAGDCKNDPVSGKVEAEGSQAGCPGAGDQVGITQ